MSKIGPYLRKSGNDHFHWCPACEEMHVLPGSWLFNGRYDDPSFQPSFKHSGHQRNIVNGKWVGDGKDAWIYGADGKPLPYVCHYILDLGVLNFCSDCTHAFAGKSVPLPELPEHDES